MYLEALCILYELQQNRILASKTKLNELGVTDEQIHGMLEHDLIYQNDSGAYLLSPVKKLFAFGYDNLLLGNKRTSLGIFELCYKIKPKHRDNNILLLFCLCPTIIPKKPHCIALNISKKIITNIETINTTVLIFNPVVNVFIYSFNIIHLASV
jgi:hypothetical protein